jgi:aryl-alcohol dehydrogenase-like predicted oxidoreductase
LGFGCVQLTAHHSRKEALSVLEHAFSLGITHFDVARAYGFGRAEGILREFLRRKRHTVTLATKFGIEPPSGLVGNVRVINALKRILRRFPRLLQQAKQHGAAMVKTGIFTPESALRSLETSLRELGTDYVDIFLLHEATLADASAAPLVETLLSQVAKGKIRQVGVASDFRKFPRDADLLPAAYEILQFNDNVVDRSVGKLAHRDHRLLITHSIFTPAGSLRNAVHAHPQITRDYSLRMNIDLAEPSAIDSLLLRFALWSNANGIVLFSSKNPQHIAANVREADSEPYDDARMLQFVEFVDQLLAMMSPHPGVTDSHGTGTLRGPS